MGKRVGIFMDIANIYGTVAKKYNNRKLDYQSYYDFVKDFGEIVMANAYGSQMNNEATAFIGCLKSIGYHPKYKKIKSYTNDTHVKHKADWDVGIAVDIVKAIPNLDMIILGSADGDFQPLTDWILEQGKQVIVLACGISRDLREACTNSIEIPESLLEVKNEKAKLEQDNRQPDNDSSDNGRDSECETGESSTGSVVHGIDESTEGQRDTGKSDNEDT